MEITLTAENSETIFHTALCNGLDYISGHGLVMDYKRKDYDEAKQKLNSPCYEDVLLQILRDGNSLQITDEDTGEYTRTITLDDVHSRVEKTPSVFLAQMIEENDDAETADVVLQTVFFEDIIFG
jgi:hypothetical protein